jgi:hypothetical protein
VTCTALIAGKVPFSSIVCDAHVHTHCHTHSTNSRLVAHLLTRHGSTACAACIVALLLSFYVLISKRVLKTLKKICVTSCLKGLEQLNRRFYIILGRVQQMERTPSPEHVELCGLPPFTFTFTSGVECWRPKVHVSGCRLVRIVGNRIPRIHIVLHVLVRRPPRHFGQVLLGRDRVHVPAVVAHEHLGGDLHLHKTHSVNHAS